MRPRPLARPSVRLIAFHHAGGSSAMYHPMSAGLPADWELLVLDLPGRGKRHAEPALREMPALLERVIDDVRPWLDAPVALFGHSLGAILAAEVGRACDGLGAPPVWVGVSGRVAPSLQAQAPRLSHLDDATLLGELIALGGTSGRIHEVPELRAHLMRIVRSDIALLESYAPADGRAALSCPVTAFAGVSDVWAPPAAMLPWARETRGAFRQRLYPGGHFYFLGAAFADLVRDVVAELAPQVAPRAHEAAQSAG
ncbi:MAG TPA: alpha/beta fold hydrolase [Kofleriaceae bacterium]|nr:alpha/beta fold hydrolase [Kofleriaceae bacterium]